MRDPTWLLRIQADTILHEAGFDPVVFCQKDSGTWVLDRMARATQDVPSCMVDLQCVQVDELERYCDRVDLALRAERVVRGNDGQPSELARASTELLGAVVMLLRGSAGISDRGER